MGQLIFPTILIFLICNYNINCESIGNNEILLVNVIYRHGDRTPYFDWPTDVNKWPHPLAELTQVGMKDHFKLGKWLQKRYNSILGKNYSPNKIYVRSTDYNRTIASALVNLAGLFPPEGDQLWTKQLAWQPIPVHPVPAEYDYLIGYIPLPSCPRSERLIKQQKNTPKFRQMMKDAQPLLDFLTEQTGRNISDVDDAAGVRDTLLVESLKKKPLNKWASEVYPGEELLKLEMISFLLPTYTKELMKLRSGYLLKEILDRCTNKSQSTLSPDVSMYAYSGHDNTIINTLHSLGLYNEKSELPPYASCILIELRKFNNEFYVDIYYKEPEKDPVPQFITGCGGSSCTLPQMYEVFKDILPTVDIRTACHS